MRFMHIADIHLGYQQYGLTERFNDFGRMFLHLVDVALAEKVNFVLLAGDLFEKRAVDPLAMRVAVEGFAQLQGAGVPVLAVEGNHERSHYKDQYSWIDFLDALGYIRLLNPRFTEDGAHLMPHGEEGGAYSDLGNGVRVYGMKYYGASTRKALSLLADSLAKMDHSQVRYTILMTHAGVEGQMSHVGGASFDELSPLRTHIDYLALGHFHKPFCIDDWCYNPGSPETWSMDEVEWPERGYYLVDILPTRNPKHRAQVVAPPRRPFHRFTLAVDTFTTPNSVYDAVRALISREDRRVVRNPQPIIELTLTGILPFSRYDLELDYVQGLLAEAWSPLGPPHVVNRAVPAEFEIDVDSQASRGELEEAIVQGLLERDVRFRAGSDVWTEGALELKRLGAGNSPSDEVIAFLRQLRHETASLKGDG